MSTYLLAQLEFLLRIVIAGVCGALIGYERKNRMKEAGLWNLSRKLIRTKQYHKLVRIINKQILLTYSVCLF